MTEHYNDFELDRHLARVYANVPGGPARRWRAPATIAVATAAVVIIAGAVAATSFLHSGANRSAVPPAPALAPQPPTPPQLVNAPSPVVLPVGTPVPIAGIFDMAFANAQDGLGTFYVWPRLADGGLPGFGAGPTIQDNLPIEANHQETFQVARTTDGGEHWFIASTTTLPANYIVAASPTVAYWWDPLGADMTTDGGRTWQPLHLPGVPSQTTSPGQGGILTFTNFDEILVHNDSAWVVVTANCPNAAAPGTPPSVAANRIQGLSCIFSAPVGSSDWSVAVSPMGEVVQGERTDTYSSGDQWGTTEDSVFLHGTTEAAALAWHGGKDVIVTSGDGAQTWTDRTRDLPPQCTSGDWHLSQSPDGTLYLLGFAPRGQNPYMNENLPLELCRSVDGGRTWSVVAVATVTPGGGQGATGQGLSGIQSLVTPGSGLVIVAGSVAVPSHGNGGTALVSNDNGQTWRAVQPDTHAAHPVDQVFALDPQHAWIWDPLTGAMERTTDGTHWVQVAA